jgi:hypothetical protein
VGPRAVLDMVKGKIPSLRRESNPRTLDRPARSPALYRLSYHGSVNIFGDETYKPMDKRHPYYAYFFLYFAHSVHTEMWQTRCFYVPFNVLSKTPNTNQLTPWNDVP